MYWEKRPNLFYNSLWGSPVKKFNKLDSLLLHCRNLDFSAKFMGTQQNCSYIKLIRWTITSIFVCWCNCLQVGGPFWDVPLGRKDSRTAGYELASFNMPTADEGVLSIISKFLYQGLTVTDMVALSGTQKTRSSIKNFISVLTTQV